MSDYTWHPMIDNLRVLYLMRAMHTESNLVYPASWFEFCCAIYRAHTVHAPFSGPVYKPLICNTSSY